MGFLAIISTLAHPILLVLPIFIACNDVSRADIGFASDDNAMQVFFSERYEHDSVTLEKASKDKIAEQLTRIIGETLWQRYDA